MMGSGVWTLSRSQSHPQFPGMALELSTTFLPSFLFLPPEPWRCSHPGIVTHTTLPSHLCQLLCSRILKPQPASCCAHLPKGRGGQQLAPPVPGIFASEMAKEGRGQNLQQDWWMTHVRVVSLDRG